MRLEVSTFPIVRWNYVPTIFLSSIPAGPFFCIYQLVRGHSSLNERIALKSTIDVFTLRNRKTLADSQGTSIVLCGDDLKSKLSGLLAQPIFRAADGVSFRLVKDALVVGLLCAQQVVNDSG